MTFRTASCLATLLVVVAASSLLGAQVDTGRKDAGAKAEKPAFPQPKIDDPELAAAYAEGIQQLENREYAAAKTTFTKLGRALSGEAELAADRCCEEAKAGLEAEKIAVRNGKGQYRRAIRDAEKALRNYQGLVAAEEIQALLDEANAAIYRVIEDFEKSSSGEAGESPEPDADDEDEDEDEGGNRRGGNRNQGGRTGFGQNTSIEKRDPNAPQTNRALAVANVRQGDHALLWRTGRDLSFVTFDDLAGKLEGYRYLNLSIRVEDKKSAPALRVFFDAEEGALNAGGQGGRGGRRGARGAARLTTRMGFVHTIQPDEKWQDIRIDLKKFKAQSNARWEDVLALRIIHTPGADGRVYIDNVRLEKK